MGELVSLEVDEHIATQEAIVENEVDAKVVVVEGEAFLAGFEEKAFPEFEQERFQFADDGGFEVIFRVAGMVGEAEEFRSLRDTVQVVGFLLSVGIFLSPILFPASMFPENWRWVLYANPMTAWVQAYQAVLLQGAWPSAAAWAGMAGWLLVALLVLRPVVRRSRDELVDWL